MTKWFFQKMGQPQPLFAYFWSFQTNITIFTTNQCEHISCPSSILHQNSNQQPLKHELSPITTKTMAPAHMTKCYTYKSSTKMGCLDSQVGNHIQI